MRLNSFLMALAAFALSTACDATGPVEPGPDNAAFTVDASAGWAYVSLGTEPAPISVSTPTTSTAWDLGFNATSVMLNGGAAGPGGVEAICLCQNAAATPAEVLAMTATSERALFDAVVEADIPATGWQTETLSAAVSGWYAYNPIAHTVAADTTKSWKLRLSGDASPAFAKFRVKSMAGSTQAAPGLVTIEYAVQSGVDQPLSEVRTAVLDAGTGRAYFDFDGGVAGAGNWDISLEGYTLRVNGGVSGSGGVGAVAVTEPFHTITDAGDVPLQVYRGDTFGGVFVSSPWYRYNLTGAHDVSPNYNVYLIRRGASVWKLQLTGYYSADGTPRHISFRSEKLAG